MNKEISHLFNSRAYNRRTVHSFVRYEGRLQMARTGRGAAPINNDLAEAPLECNQFCCLFMPIASTQHAGLFVE